MSTYGPLPLGIPSNGVDTLSSRSEVTRRDGGIAGGRCNRQVAAYVLPVIISSRFDLVGTVSSRMLLPSGPVATMMLAAFTRASAFRVGWPCAKPRKN
jgi:hypothetical protein